VVVGVLHPGEMGSALASLLRELGATVLWASEGRSAATAERAAQAGLVDAGSAVALARQSDLILSVCPPHAAVALAESVRGFDGVYLDANAVSPATARSLGAVLGRLVDGGIVGPAPRGPGTTRLYLSGPEAPLVADLFAGTVLETPVVSDRVGDASAVKMAYAAWTKGTTALLLSIRALARAEGIEKPLLAEWAVSQPALEERSTRSARVAGAKGWRWVGEMEEIASTFAAAGLPLGFHEAAAEIFRRAPRLDGATLDDVLARLE
jgi:3-hydroxyisobutyrate dehydrogenase-like beta-hydroxyacid dehydrogenase